MPTIHLETILPTDIQTAFDLARSVDAHLNSAARTQEQVVGGRSQGLLELGDRVRWRARHFAVWQELEVEITAMDNPHYFQDVMLEGAFASMIHDHHFTARSDTQTLMVDDFHFQAPLGPLGRLAEYLFLERYLRRFLQERNRVLVELAARRA